MREAVKPRGMTLGLTSLMATIEAAFERARFVAGEEYGRHLDMTYLDDLRRQAVEHVRAANPSHACPWCNQQGCRVCHDTGWVPRDVAARAPREIGGAA